MWPVQGKYTQEEPDASSPIARHQQQVNDYHLNRAKRGYEDPQIALDLFIPPREAHHVRQPEGQPRARSAPAKSKDYRDLEIAQLRAEVRRLNREEAARETKHSREVERLHAIIDRLKPQPVKMSSTSLEFIADAYGNSRYAG